MKPLLQLLVGLCFASPLAAETLLVDNGQPRAAIVVAESPPRTVRLAAQELQDYVEKITGAHLPIVTQLGRAGTVPIYVGRSEHTDRLRITAEGLQDGAYRIVSGDGWLVLIGQDTEFTPIEPWARNNADIVSGKLQREWDQITGALWGVPQATLYKNRFTLPGDTGWPDEQRKAGQKLAPLEMWGFDERGTFNAVCGWLMKLGVRWYAPGELGEVLPTLHTIPLPQVDETVRPDFPIRRFNVRFGVHGHELAMWAMRLGVRDPYGIQVAHGMDDMTHREEIFARHPDWFALYGGNRHNQPGQRLNQLCYSSEELFQETRLSRAGSAGPVVRLRLGFRQSCRQRSAQDAPEQEGPQLCLRCVHPAAAEDRPTGAERRRLDRRGPPPDEQPVRGPGRGPQAARKLAREDRQSPHYLRELPVHRPRLVSALLHAARDGREHQRDQGPLAGRGYLAQRAAGLRESRHGLQSLPHLLHPAYVLGRQAIARIQAKRGQFDEALATLGKVELDKLRGFWHDSMLLARGDTLRAADRKAEALAAYKSILAEDSGDPRLRKVAEEKIKSLEGRQP